LTTASHRGGELEQLVQCSDAAVAAHVQTPSNILLLQIVELVNFGGSMWLDDNSSRSLCLRRSQPPIFPGLFLGVLANDIVIWFWIGSHDNYYERLIRDSA
jgi:hypothetical protein